MGRGFYAGRAYLKVLPMRRPASSRRVIPAALLAALPMSAFAQAAPAANLGGSAIQLFLSLLLVFALLVGSLWLLKRLSTPRGAPGGLLKVVAATAVGARERVVVLEVGSSWLVLGVAPGRVSALAEVPRQALPDTPAVDAPLQVPGWLARVIERRNAR
jgi:flagellar protein FliO/FliZ